MSLVDMGSERLSHTTYQKKASPHPWSRCHGRVVKSSIQTKVLSWFIRNSEASRLESEVRRVERCASGGAELRERARLAAAAHARERRLAAAELQHTSRELLRANG